MIQGPGEFFILGKSSLVDWDGRRGDSFQFFFFFFFFNQSVEEKHGPEKRYRNAEMDTMYS